MKLRNKKTMDIDDFYIEDDINVDTGEHWVSVIRTSGHHGMTNSWHFQTLKELYSTFEDYIPQEPLIKGEKIRKAVRAWAEAENCTSEMNLYYTLNRQEKYITFHNPQTGSELQLCDFDSPVFQEMREYTITELCGEEDYE